MRSACSFLAYNAFPRFVALKISSATRTQRSTYNHNNGFFSYFRFCHTNDYNTNGKIIICFIRFKIVDILMAFFPPWIFQ